MLLAVIAGLAPAGATVFWFYENDSSDGTSTLLQGTTKWLEREGHEVQLLSETQPKGMVAERSSARAAGSHSAATACSGRRPSRCSGRCSRCGSTRAW